MLHRFNKFFRLSIVLLLLSPVPVYAEETTVTEGFDNQELNEDITFVYGGNDTAVSAETDCDNSQAPGSINIEDMDCHGGNPYFGSDRYQFGLRSSTDALTIAFPNSETKPVTEVGFISMAVDEANTGTIYYDDSTSATFNIATNDGNNPNQVTLAAPTGTTINEIIILGASDNLGDWWLIDNIYYKYTAPTPTTTTTSSTTTTTTTTSSTTTTTIPPPPPAPPEPPPPPPPPPVITVILDDGTEAEYEEYEVEDGTVERDNERRKNEELYGCYITDAALERGDCDIPEEVIEDDIYEEEIYEEEYEEGEELLDDVIVVLEMADDDELEELEVIELTEEEILALEKEMEIEAKELELLEESEEMLEELGLLLTEEEYEELTEEEIFELEKELEEYVEVILEIEEYIDDIEVFETEIIIIEEDIDLIDIFIANDLFPPDPEDVLKDLESVQDELTEEEVIIVEEIIEEIIEEEDEVFEIFEIFEEPDDEEILTEEMVEEEVAELEEVIEDIIVIDIPEATEEEIEEFTEEELVEYEEAKEEAIQEFVEELTEEEVVEVLEEVNDIGVQNLSEATEEVQGIVQAVVEEAIEDIEELTEEQVEVVAEVLQVEAEDVEIIAEAVKDDEIVAEAVEEYVERAVENKDVENYTLADVVTEVQYEEFLENPIEVFVDFDNLEKINLENIGDDMTSDQREKAQEVVVPVILTRIASMAAFILRKS